MNNRHTLTKSLHTVTAVANVVREILLVRADAGRPIPTGHDLTDRLAKANANIALVRAALTILGQRADWDAGDPTFAACVAAVAKVRA